MEIKQLTQEELAAEQAAMAEAKVEEVRDAVVKEFGFDPDLDEEKIVKAVERELAHKKALSSAIGQKIKHRTEAEELRKNSSKKDEKPAVADAATVSAEVTKALENRDLEDMEVPEPIKAEVKKLAALQGISVKRAAKDPYIVHQVEQYKKTQTADDAALGRKPRGVAAGTGGDDANTPPDVDMNTAEGRKKWDDWKSKVIKKEGGGTTFIHRR